MSVRIELPALSVMLDMSGRIFYRYPESAFYEQLFAEGVFAEMPADIDNEDFKSGCALLNRCNASPEDLSAVESDYTTLFILGKAETAPWHSAFTNPERLLFEPSMLKVREWYKKYDLMSKRQYKEPDDHVGLMLIFAGFLADKAEKTGDSEVIKDFNDFCSGHLLNWVPQWCDQVALYAKTDFFKGMALLTKGVLRSL